MRGGLSAHPEGYREVGRLQEKVRKQAAELVGLTDALQHQTKYSKLVEARLQEIYPGHPLPVRRAHLGSTSRSLGGAGMGTTAAAEPKLSDLSQRDFKSLLGELSALRNAYDEARSKLDASTRTVRDLRLALQSKEKDARAAERRSASMTEELQAAEKRSQESALAKANLAQLEGELHRLRKELVEESENSKESMLQVQALRTSLEIRAEELGLSAGGAGLLEQLAEIRQEAKLAMQEASTRRQLQHRLEEDLERSRKEVKDLRLKISEEVRDSSRIRDKYSELKSHESKRTSSALADLQQENGHLRAQLRELSAKLREMSVGEDTLRRAKAALADTLDELERVNKELAESRLRGGELEQRLEHEATSTEALRRELDNLTVNAEEMGLMHMEALRLLSASSREADNSERLKDELDRQKRKNAELEKKLTEARSAGAQPDVVAGLERQIDDLKRTFDILEFDDQVAVKGSLAKFKGGYGGQAVGKDGSCHADGSPIWDAVQRESTKHKSSSGGGQRGEKIAIVTRGEPRFLLKLRSKLHRAQMDLARLRAS